MALGLGRPPDSQVATVSCQTSLARGRVYLQANSSIICDLL